MVRRPTGDAAVAEPRIPLSRPRVLDAAVALADRDGLEAVTMRRLAQELGVEAMSLYHHVANKEAVLDGVAEVVMGEINDAVTELDAPPPGEDWRAAMRARILAAREVMLRHPWAPSVLQTRTAISLEVMAYIDGFLAVLIEGGFSYDLAHHAMHVFGSRGFGFTIELFEPDDPEVAEAEAGAMLAAMADRFPYLTGMMGAVAHGTEGQLGWCDDQAEFEFGLDVILDGLEPLRARSAGER